MPKETLREFTLRMAQLYPKVFRADNTVLFCVVCDCKVEGNKIFSVKQHLNTSKHKNAEKRKSESAASTSQTLVTAFQPPTLNVDRFHLDTCKAFLEANIPLKKIGHPSIVKYLEKYTDRAIPSESTLRNKYVTSIHDECIQKLRAKAANSYIWVTLDETQDSEQRYVANFLFGVLNDDEDERGKCYLLNLAVLEHVDGSTTSAFFVDSLSILWPNGRQNSFYKQLDRKQ